MTVSDLRKTDLYYLMVIFFLTCLMSLPLLSSTRIIDQTDMFISFLKLAGMHQSWIYGDWTGRWIPDINYGYGYPIFNYYPPLFYYLGAGLGFLFQNIVVAFNMMVFLCMFISGVTMYFFAKEFWGKPGAIFSAVLYLFAPFHILHVYVLGSCAQLLAFVFFPLILLAQYRLHSTKTFGDVVFLAASVAGLSLSHNGQTMVFFPVAIAYAVYLELVRPSAGRIVAFGTKMIAMLWGMSISAYFWVPALLEKQYVFIEKSVSAYYDFHNHFIATLSEFLFSPWGYDFIIRRVQIGWTHLICCFLFLCMVPFLWKKHRNSVLMGIFILLVAMGAVFMTMRASMFIWDHVSVLRFLQFPWRFLTVVTFSISFVAGGVLLILNRKHRLIAGALILLVTVSWNIRYCHPMKYRSIDARDAEKILYENNPGDNMEYLPIGVKKVYMPRLTEKLGSFVGKMDISHEEIKGLDCRYVVFVQAPTLAVFYSFYFPGWEVDVDNKRTQIMTDNDFGLIVFPVSPGEHTVRIHFASTPVRDIAGRVSFLSGFCLLLLAGYVFLKRHRKWTNFILCPVRKA